MVHSKKHMKTWPIKNLLVIPGSILTLSLSVALIAAISTYSYQNLRQVFESQLEGNTQLFVETITNPVLLGQDQSVYQGCILLKSQPAVKHVRIIRAHATQPVCSAGSNEVGKWDLKMSREIFFNGSEGDPAAEVVIVYNLDALRTNVLSWIFLGIALAFGIIISHGLLYRFLARMVADPIAKISSIISTQEPAQIVNEFALSASKVYEVNLLEEKTVEMAKGILKYQSDLKKRERDRVTGELARQIAHDIRSPLSALKILNSKLPASFDQLDLMKSVIARIDGMAEGLLEKSRALPETHSLENVRASLIGLGKSLSLKCIARGVNLITDFPNPLSQLAIYVNLNIFERVVVNLVENAIDASPAGTSISISTFLSDRFFHLEIRDQGNGLPIEIERNLGSEKTLSTKPGGNGLGLVSAYQSISDWSGEIVYRKTEPTGASFLIKLPLIGNPEKD